MGCWLGCGNIFQNLNINWSFQVCFSSLIMVEKMGSCYLEKLNFNTKIENTIWWTWLKDFMSTLTFRSLNYHPSLLHQNRPDNKKRSENMVPICQLSAVQATFHLWKAVPFLFYSITKAKLIYSIKIVHIDNFTILQPYNFTTLQLYIWTTFQLFQLYNFTTLQLYNFKKF